jgi:hypothetical protein
MDLVAPDAQLTLGYLAALDAQGYRPTADELNEFAERPERRGAVRAGGVFDTMMSTYLSFSKVLQGTRTVSPAETMTDYFVRLRWVERRADRIEITLLGRALSRAFSLSNVSVNPVIVLEPGDPTVLGRVVERLASCGDGLLVDPYFRLDQLMMVASQTELTKILISERLDRGSREGLKTGIEQLVLPRPLEVRVAGRELHDRYLIPTSGSITAIGSSVNGVGTVVTAMNIIVDGADDLRTTYEKMWAEAVPLASAQESNE